MSQSQGIAVVPNPVISLVAIFNKIHRIWRTFRLAKIYSNPDNFLKIAAGHSLNYVFGDSKILRISALCVLIATRILACVEQQYKLQDSWIKFMGAIKGHYPTPIKVEWESKPTPRIFSTSTTARWKYKSKRTLDKIKRITTSAFQVIKDAFILSMRITDAIETFYLSPETRNEGINLLFVNGTMWIDKLAKNRKKLVEALTNNKTVIDKILKGIHSSITSDQLIQNANVVLKKTETLSKNVESASQSVGGFIRAYGQKLLHEAATGLGLENFVPPPKTPEWNLPEVQKKTERHPPISLVTKPSMLKMF